jgi:hypothetical protein
MSASPVSTTPEWVLRSNENAKAMLDVIAQFGPEQASFVGLTGYDDRVVDVGPDLTRRYIEAMRKAVESLRGKMAGEKHPAVRQDLEIMVKRGELGIRGAELSERLLLPYYNLNETIFQGLRALLDDQVPQERRRLAVARLQRYTGMGAGQTPVARLAQDRIREKLGNAALVGPFKDEMDKDFGNSGPLLRGVQDLFRKYEITGFEAAYAELSGQLDAYWTFVKEQVGPRCRPHFALPPEIYANSIERIGIDMPIDELTSRARAAFREIQNEMQSLALLVAKERGLGTTGYREVLAELKKTQIVGEGILPHYEARIAQLEALIREHDIITLPDRPMQIRLASEAESAAIPAPNMRPPRMIGNTGELGTFVLPLRIPGQPGRQQLQFDDFTFDASSWTLTAHEGRPGHELQFAAMVETGVSIARAIFAMNSTNVEGWALYAEAEMKPFEPLEGQLAALQHRLLRSARAFLDPGLQAGTITRDEAMRVLREDVVLSEAMATQEVERYTFWAPAQAPSYFCGYQRLLEIRTDVERTLGARFNRRKYHDFLLAQGLLPPSLLRKAVFEDFVPSQKA